MRNKDLAARLFVHLLTLLLLYLPAGCWSPDLNAQATGTGLNMPLLTTPQTFDRVSKRTNKLTIRLQKASERHLRKFRQLEAMINQIITDTIKRNLDMMQFPSSCCLFDSTTGNNLATFFYSGRLDSLTTSLKLLKEQNALQPIDQTIINQTLGELQLLNTNLAGSSQLASFIQNRLQRYCYALPTNVFAKKLLAYQKEFYYYKTRIHIYERQLEAPDKWSDLLIRQARRLPQFQSFFARNSQLGQLFAMPGVQVDDLSNHAATGLQTRAAVEEGFRNRFGSAADLNVTIQSHMPESGVTQDGLRSRAEGFVTGVLGGAGTLQMPAGFKPNMQKTKTFWKRLEPGCNIQSLSARYLFPVTTDIGLSLGYKLNDRSILGVGTSYKLGWGQGWDHIALTHQGLSLRSFVDVQLKGSIYISGGYEQNYRAAFNSIAALKNYSAWQGSGLIGMTKKYTAGKLKGNMQLLWDFLSYYQQPRAANLLWRIGYVF